MTIKALYNGKNIIPQEPEKLIEYKCSLADDAVLALTFEPWEERRTGKQQRLLHALLGRLARAWGMSLEVVKVQFKTELGYYLPATKILDGTLRPKWRGKFVDLAEVYSGHEPELVFLRSEADYTRKMESEFTERVLLACDENGVDVSDILESIDDKANAD